MTELKLFCFHDWIKSFIFQIQRSGICGEWLICVVIIVLFLAFFMPTTVSQEIDYIIQAKDKLNANITIMYLEFVYVTTQCHPRVNCTNRKNPLDPLQNHIVALEWIFPVILT